MKFLCDRMCLELGKWLRAAGYDTELVETSMDDQKIFQRALEEKRFLITRDRDFKKLDPEKKVVIYLTSEDLDVWAKQLKEKGVNWFLSPFSRCLVCNTPFKKVSVPSELPEGVPDDVKEFWSCPKCDQLFWLGSHTEHMEERLKTWQKGLI